MSDTQMNARRAGGIGAGDTVRPVMLASAGDSGTAKTTAPIEEHGETPDDPLSATLLLRPTRAGADGNG